MPASVDWQFVLEPTYQYIDAATNTGVGAAPKAGATRLGWTLYRNRRFVSPLTPMLLSKYYGKPLDATSIAVGLGDVVQIVIQTPAGNCSPHAWHLHGQPFWLVGHGAGVFPGPTATLNLVDPPRLDTVGCAHCGGWMALRFVASRPGMWAFHCAAGSHFYDGLGVVFDVASSQVDPPPADLAYCGAVPAPATRPGTSAAPSASAAASAAATPAASSSAPTPAASAAVFTPAPSASVAPSASAAATAAPPGEATPRASPGGSVPPAAAAEGEAKKEPFIPVRAYFPILVAVLFCLAVIVIGIGKLNDKGPGATTTITLG